MSGLPMVLERARLQELLDIAPFHQWLGLKIQSCSEDGLELTMPWRAEIISNPVLGAAHGGVLAALIDLTGLYTLLMLGTRAKATADLRVDYHRPATAGPLVARGQVIKIGRQISVAEARIFGPDDKLLASGRGAYIC
ncbi:hotdog fold thioesterase [Blastomonas fulva]|uniref:Medium/long-chain acyl-CoA thioesterase YigI n=1 Tax=Blastomonas fulva TaxID=1550728 RepID=A0ABN5BDN0_9SPHN|nr:hotdog fold thioesterase [Blastomonas fulva]ASR53699.1 thioesterase [Blastomonas fulva]MBE5074637.1 hotdog fold thioesterase [Erythrobacteraceae bacterium E2-1 Yellow Sea]